MDDILKGNADKMSMFRKAQPKTGQQITTGSTKEVINNLIKERKTINY